MNIRYFVGVSSIEELKKAYRKLCKEFHPDLNRDRDTTKDMADINNEYEWLFPRLEKQSEFKKGEKHSVNDGFREMINELMKDTYSEVTVEIIGCYIWLSGNTYPIKEQINHNGLGFEWSQGNKKYYWYEGIEKNRDENGKRIKKYKGSKSWDDKVNTYGYEKVKEGTRKEYRKLA